MKLTIPARNSSRIRPDVPAVSLTPEAYDMLLELSAKSGASMRAVASAIITSVGADIEIEKEGAKK